MAIPNGHKVRKEKRMDGWKERREGKGRKELEGRN
jgi:hypothetical protein